MGSRRDRAEGLPHFNKVAAGELFCQTHDLQFEKRGDDFRGGSLVDRFDKRVKVDRLVSFERCKDLSRDRLVGLG